MAVPCLVLVALGVRIIVQQEELAEKQGFPREIGMYRRGAIVATFFPDAPAVRSGRVGSATRMAVG